MHSYQRRKEIFQKFQNEKKDMDISYKSKPNFWNFCALCSCEVACYDEYNRHDDKKLV